MMMAGVGSSTNVTGIKMAVPAEGPMPGRTPIKVPRRQPTSAKRRFIGWSAVANPFSSSVRVSMFVTSLDADTSTFSVRLLKKAQMQGGEAMRGARRT